MNPIGKIYNDEMCVICYFPFEKEKDNQCLILKCRHIFHKECVERWINEHESCPLCRERAFAPILWRDMLETVLVREKVIGNGLPVVYKAFVILTVLAIFNLLNQRLFSDEEYPSAFGTAIETGIRTFLFGLGVGVGGVALTGIRSMVKSLSSEEIPLSEERRNFASRQVIYRPRNS